MERALIMSDFQPETVRAIAVAYRDKRRAGKMDEPARRAAEIAHAALVPELSRELRSTVVTQIESRARPPGLVLARGWGHRPSDRAAYGCDQDEEAFKKKLGEIAKAKPAQAPEK